jgi:hypothetical protein
MSYLNKKNIEVLYATEAEKPSAPLILSDNFFLDKKLSLLAYWAEWQLQWL